MLLSSESVYRNTTTSGILEPDRGADLGLPPHDTPLPDEGAEPPTDGICPIRSIRSESPPEQKDR